MSIYLRIILVVISMLSMMNVMKRVRRFKLQIENSIFWIIFSLLLILVAVFPDVLACRPFGHSVSGKYGISLCYLYPFN